MNYSHKITIFTPSYNRAFLLPRLYESLILQSYKDFEWLIVDDGSTDNTEQIVSEWLRSNKIPIRYYKQENGGKHRAINKGLDLANGELFFIVDSDDELPNNSLSYIYKYSKNISNNLVGVVGRKQYFNKGLIGKKFPKKQFISDPINKTYELGLKGDLAEVVKTEILKQCKFPDFEGEKFSSESMMWNQLSKKGFKLLYFDVPVYNAEYLYGGLTSNSIQNRRKSGKYSTLLYKELAEYDELTIKHKFRAYINFWRFSFYNGRSISQNFILLEYKYIGFVTFPFGVIATIFDYFSILHSNKK